MLADDADRDEAQQRAVVQQAIGRADLPIELLASGRWELAALVAGRFSCGRAIARLRHDQIFARADNKAHLDTAEPSVPVIDDDATWSARTPGTTTSTGCNAATNDAKPSSRRSSTLPMRSSPCVA